MPDNDSPKAAPPGAQLPANSVDRELVEKLLAGDERAFSELVSLHHGALVRLARMFVSTQASAEEVVQETWVAVLTGLPRFQGRSSLKTWIFRILSNRAKTRGVREGRSIPMSAFGDGDSDSEPSVDPSRFKKNGGWDRAPTRWEVDGPDQLLERGELKENILAAIHKLPPNQSAVITLRDVEGWTSAEVCNALELSETNQRVLLHRARTRVRRALAGYLNGEAQGR